MFNTSLRNASTAYARVGVETGVAGANPHRLILMLYDGALAALAAARIHLQARDIGPKCEAIAKAVAIVDTGLKASLDRSQGGELVDRLAGLYDYMVARLIQANASNDAAPLEEVQRLLTDLRGAWAQIGATADPKSAAPAAVAKS